MGGLTPDCQTFSTGKRSPSPTPRHPSPPLPQSVKRTCPDDAAAASETKFSHFAHFDAVRGRYRNKMVNQSNGLAAMAMIFMIFSQFCGGALLLLLHQNFRVFLKQNQYHKRCQICQGVYWRACWIRHKKKTLAMTFLPLNISGATPKTSKCSPPLQTEKWAPSLKLADECNNDKIDI